MKYLLWALMLLSGDVFANQISKFNNIQVNASDSASIIHAHVNIVWQNQLVEEQYVYAAREAVLVAMKQFKSKEITDSYAIGMLKDDIKKAINEAKSTSGYKIEDVFITQLYLETAQAEANFRSSKQQQQLDKAMLVLLKKLAQQ